MLRSAGAPSTLAVVALLILYHVIGVRAHTWMMRRAWSVALFVPLGWGLLVAAVSLHAPFSLLLFGAILQGFVFLPYTAAIATLGIVVLWAVAVVLRTPSGMYADLTVARVAGLLATGIMLGTVMLYIHRVNRDAAIRARLLHDLERAERDLADRARDAGVQEERQRFARDIHDTLAQGFTSVIKHLEAVELSFAASGARTDAAVSDAMSHVANAQDVSRTSLAEIRRVVWALRPTQLVETPLAAAIERTVAAWSAANDVRAECTIPDLPGLRADADVIFLRATQEALSNVARHAQATRVAVAMHVVDGLVLLSVEDDGRGFVDSESTRADGTGIPGMRERVRPFGGHVLIDSDIANGTSLTVALPLAAIAAPQHE